MAYEKVGFTDGTTPLDMENFNHMEDGIAANAEDIAQVNADLTDLKCVNYDLNNNSTYQLLWRSGSVTAPRCVGLILLRGANSQNFASLLYSAYGTGETRMNIAELLLGTSITYSIESDNYAVDINIPSTVGAPTLTLVCFMGEIPTVTKIA